MRRSVNDHPKHNPGRLLAVVAAAVLLAACGGGSKKGYTPPPDSGPHTSRPGLGDSNAAPTGTPLALPAGVALAADLEARNERCDQDPLVRYGNGTTVWLCLGFTNSTQQPITVELPPGLIIVSRDLAYQNGILVKTATIVVPPATTAWYPLDSYCVNFRRHAPSWMPPEEQPRYGLGPVTVDPALLELIALLAPKQLPLFGSIDVQVAVWAITDGDGLTAEARAAIAALPDA